MTDQLDFNDDNITEAISQEIARARASSRRTVNRRTAQANNQRAQLQEHEYHTARLLILISEMAGDSGQLKGLTKLAKLDFLVRYPVFLEQLANSGVVKSLVLPEEALPTSDEREAVESRMIRYKYGPWDDKYYTLIGSLVGRGLAEYVDNDGLCLRLTKGGQALARTLATDKAWVRTAVRCRALKAAFNRTTGNRLKELIYAQFPDAVDRPYRMEI